MQRFIVCRDRLPFSASIHDTLEQAQVAAERLCRKEQDTFLVFALMGEVRLARAPLTWEWYGLTTGSTVTAAPVELAGMNIDDGAAAGEPNR